VINPSCVPQKSFLQMNSHEIKVRLKIWKSHGGKGRLRPNIEGERISNLLLDYNTTCLLDA
jgi:hypothetical protein